MSDHGRITAVGSGAETTSKPRLRVYYGLYSRNNTVRPRFIGYVPPLPTIYAVPHRTSPLSVDQAVKRGLSPGLWI